MKYEFQVIITQLKVEASQHETQEFLDEAKFWAEATWGKGPQTNVVRMLGVCLDSPPFMVVFDAGTFTCDLKTFLINGRGDAEEICSLSLLHNKKEEF